MNKNQLLTQLNRAIQSGKTLAELQQDTIAMHKSAHSKMRCRQRGIKEIALDLIQTIGTKTPKPGGAYEIFVSNKDKQVAVEMLKQCIQELDKLVGKAIVVTEDGTILTTYHKAE